METIGHRPIQEVIPMQGITYYIPGAILVFLAVLIVAVPEILIAFVAASVLISGVGLLYLGHRMRRSAKDIWESRQGIHHDPFGDGPFVRQTVSSYWHHKHR
jgi:hypothetical protein